MTESEVKINTSIRNLLKESYKLGKVLSNLSELKYEGTLKYIYISVTLINREYDHVKALIGDINSKITSIRNECKHSSKVLDPYSDDHYYCEICEGRFSK